MRKRDVRTAVPQGSRALVHRRPNDHKIETIDGAKIFIAETAAGCARVGETLMQDLEVA
jgi:hypothetical protein